MVCGSKSKWKRNPILWRELTLERLFSRLVIAMSIHFFVITYRVLETSLSLGHPWICKGDAKKQTPGHKYIYLHLRDNSKIPACDSADGDTLYQPRPFLASLTANLFHCYNPYSKQAVEEARIQYKRCTSLKQYMPMKSIKHEPQKTWSQVHGTCPLQWRTQT